MRFREPFSFGPIVLPNNIFYAPLAGCSDLPFRKMVCKYQPGLIFCEMVKMEALVRNDSNTFRLLDYEKDMHPIGAQICGSNPKIAAAAAKKVEDLGFDVLDLNCGCPVDKVTKDGSGSGMLKNPALIGDVLSEMIHSVKIPVTVKIRAGWDENSLNAPEITQVAEQAGAVAIAVHGRTRKQGYKGLADREIIAECKKQAKKILVIGNGDIMSASSGLDMFEKTESDAVLLSRGSMGQPWLIEDLKCLLKGLDVPIRGLEDVREALLEHCDYIIKYKAPKKALSDLKRVCCWYLKRFSDVKQVRQSINRSTTCSEILKQITSFQITHQSEVEYVSTS
jgi:tRNA-dihydrouridine synthase B